MKLYTPRKARAKLPSTSMPFTTYRGSSDREPLGVRALTTSCDMRRERSSARPSAGMEGWPSHLRRR